MGSMFLANAGVLKDVDMTGITAGITADVQTLVPIGVAIMAIMIGVSLVPKVLYKFF